MRSIIIVIYQLDLFRLRERDLLKRYASEVSQYQAQGASKENAVLLVRVTVTFAFSFFLFILLLLSLNASELSTCGRIGKGLHGTHDIADICGR